MCDSDDLTLHAMLSDEAAIIRPWVVSAIACFRPIDNLVPSSRLPNPGKVLQITC